MSERPLPSLGSAFFGTLQRELTLAVRNLSELANPVIFFLIVATLFPLGVSPDPQVLSTLAPGVIWVVALLATLLSSDGLFRRDFDDGSLEQLLTSPHPLFIIVIAKVLSHWLFTGLPLTLVAPVLGMMLFLPEAGYQPLVISLALGTLVLSFVGAIGAALTVGLRRGGLLLSLIVIPLYTPVLIFGASAVQAAVDGFAYSGQILILAAFAALAVTLAPVAISGALRISVSG